MDFIKIVWTGNLQLVKEFNFNDSDYKVDDLGTPLDYAVLFNYEDIAVYLKYTPISYHSYKWLNSYPIPTYIPIKEEVKLRSPSYSSSSFVDIWNNNKRSEVIRQIIYDRLHEEKSALGNN